MVKLAKKQAVADNSTKVRVPKMAQVVLERYHW